MRVGRQLRRGSPLAIWVNQRRYAVRPFPIISGTLQIDLRPGEVHVWSISLDQPATRLNLLSQTLSADELERAGRFRFKRDRDRFTAARATLRAILARYLGSDPASVTFTYGPQGKPAVDAGTEGVELGFNLTHSEELALVGVTIGRPIGVDLEVVRPFEDVKDVTARIFSARELAEFQSLAPSQQKPAFFSAWTRKEAVVKATGLGFSTDVAEVEVTFAPDVPARLVSLHGDAEAAAGWTLRELGTAPRYAAAVALRGPILDILRVQWEHQS
jgi:4'-phosphopantetheinyl transferase